MVGVLSRGKHRKTSPSERPVRLEGKGLGVPELLLGAGTLPHQLSDYRGVPRVCSSGQTLAAMLPRSPQRFSVGMAGDACHVLVRPHHEGVIGGVHLGRPPPPRWRCTQPNMAMSYK